MFQRLLILILLLIYTGLHFLQMGTITPTQDERTDLAIVTCYSQSWSVFSCPYDISQTRLLYYTHAFFQSLFKDAGMTAHYVVSFFSGFFTLLTMYWFTKKYYGQLVGITTVVLLVGSIPLLTTTRTILTHSNALFMLTTVLTVTLFYDALTTRNRKRLLISSVMLGISISVNLLGVYTILYLIVLASTYKKSLFNKKTIVLCLLFPIASFFATSIFYLKPSNFLNFILDVLTDRSILFPYWNYLQLNTSQSPWWFGLLLFIIKLGPVWAISYLASCLYFLQKRYRIKQHIRFLLVTGGFLLLYLLSKPLLFHYDAPHHHVHLYPFVYLTIAFSFVHLYAHLRPPVKLLLLSVVCISFSWQLYEMKQFFPNLLFYGAQYGQRFVGEFYGPAVFQCQDQAAINEKLNQLLTEKQTLVATWHSCIQVPRTKFTQFDENFTVQGRFFAYTDYVSTYHSRFPDNAAYLQFIAAYCKPYYTYSFPTNFQAYKIYQCDK